MRNGLLLLVASCLVLAARSPLIGAPAQQVLPPIPPSARDPLAGVEIREIRVLGSTVFTSEKLAKITARYVNRRLTSEDLSVLRRELTDLYVNDGYINSGALIPDQTLSGGVITVEIVEGRLTELEVQEPRWFRAEHIRKRLEPGADGPLNIQSLQERLQLLEQDPRIRRFAAELRPGYRPGEARLNVAIEEETPYSASVGFDNYQSPTVGSSHVALSAIHENLTGFGDVLSVRTGWSSGVSPQIAATYEIPLTAQDTSLAFTYTKNDFTVVEAPFDSLDVVSESSGFGLELRHPIYRTLNTDLVVGVGVERTSNRTFLLGETFSFSLGAKDGESNVTALRVSQQWTHRSQNQAVAIQSRFSFGVNLFGATIHGADSIYRQIEVENPPDGRFFAWLGKFQWARRLGRAQLIFRTDTQLATDPLLATEQLPIGGRNSVRGYRENQLVRDNAVISSLESRLTLVSDRSWARSLELAPFFDFGEGWHTTPEAAGRGRILLPVPPSRIYSVGVGVRWNGVFGDSLRWNPQFEVYWGEGLVDLAGANSPSGSLQDTGIHFSFGLRVF